MVRTRRKLPTECFWPGRGCVALFGTKVADYEVVDSPTNADIDDYEAHMKFGRR